MQVGDLVRDKRGDIGIIIFDYRQGFDRYGTKQYPQPHVWVHWCCGVSNTTHIRHLETVCK